MATNPLYLLFILPALLFNIFIAQATVPDVSLVALDSVKVELYISPTGDSIPMSTLEPLYLYSKFNKKQRANWIAWTRLRADLYVVYPYAIASAQIINEINHSLIGITDKNQRRKIIKNRERDLKKQFGDKITNLTVDQGKLLMKLINRETGDNCYEIIKEYDGGFTAGFWQTIALLFGSNLKQKYDAQGKDAVIEAIVKDIAKMYGRQ